MCKKTKSFDKKGLKIPSSSVVFMPTYLDAHDLGNATEDQLKQVQNSPQDEFGATHNNMLYSKEENKLFCILDAPNKDSGKAPPKIWHEMQLDNRSKDHCIRKV
jgi:hypothetical protein